MIQKLEWSSYKFQSFREIWDVCGNMEVFFGLVEVEGNENLVGVVKGFCYDLVKQLIKLLFVCIQIDLLLKVKFWGIKRLMLLNNKKFTGNLKIMG